MQQQRSPCQAANRTRQADRQGVGLTRKSNPGPMRAGIAASPAGGGTIYTGSNHLTCTVISLALDVIGGSSHRLASKPSHNRRHISAFPVRLHRVAATLIANIPLAGRQQGIGLQLSGG